MPNTVERCYMSATRQESEIPLDFLDSYISDHSDFTSSSSDSFYLRTLKHL